MQWQHREIQRWNTDPSVVPLHSFDLISPAATFWYHLVIPWVPAIPREEKRPHHTVWLESDRRIDGERDITETWEKLKDRDWKKIISTRNEQESSEKHYQPQKGLNVARCLPKRAESSFITTQTRGKTKTKKDWLKRKVWYSHASGGSTVSNLPFQEWERLGA